MTKISTRASVLAIVPEVTEGLLVAPTGSTVYTALQDDAKMAPNTETKQSAEILNSLAPAAPILGAEKPTFNFSHYMKASGTAGTAPDYNDLMKAFFGSEVVNSTERATVSSSTTTVINVGSGVGATDFLRGTGMLIQDNVNGWRVRVVDSRTADALSLSFGLPVAPSSGVNLSKCVYWAPVNEGHQTLSIWHYLGNPGAIQAMAGARVTGFNIDATAGDLINAAFTLEGIGYYLNPILVTSSTKYIDFTDDDGTVAAILDERWYKSPKELAAAVTTAMQAKQTSKLATCTYSDSTGLYTIACTGTVFSILFNSGTNTANSAATKLGFTTASDKTSALTYTSPNALVVTSPYVPSLDVADPNIAKANEVMFGDQTDFACFEASKLTFDGTDVRSIFSSICADTGVSGSAITSRTGKLSLTAYLSKYDVNQYNRYQQGSTVRFQFTWGPKVGGKWVKGKTMFLYLPNLKISKFDIDQSDGTATLNLEADCFADGINIGEMFCGTV